MAGEPHPQSARTGAAVAARLEFAAPRAVPRAAAAPRRTASPARRRLPALARIGADRALGDRAVVAAPGRLHCGAAGGLRQLYGLQFRARGAALLPARLALRVGRRAAGGDG